MLELLVLFQLWTAVSRWKLCCTTFTRAVSSLRSIDNIILNYVLFPYEEYHDDTGNPIWKNRVESWKEKKNKKKKNQSKAVVQEAAEVPPEQQMEEKPQ